MERQKRQSRSTVIVVAAVALVFFTTACTCCWVPAAVQRAGSFGRAMPWRDWVGSWSVGRAEAREEISQRFAAGAPLSLEMQVGVGSVRVEAGSGNTVEVRGTKYAYGPDRAAAQARLAEFGVDIRQEGAKIVVESDPPRVGEGQSPKVDLVITVPRRSDVRANVNVGDLEVSGVEGTLDLTTSVGQVTARDVDLTASSRASTNVGSVTVRLPAGASFQLDARTSVGGVSCEFPLQAESSGGTLVGKSLSGRVGESPSITLTLRANTGEVRVERE